MFSVIIPTCNRNNLLIKCLDKLSPSVQSLTAKAYEIIVTDDSKEGIAADLIQKRYEWIKWVKGSAKGPAANRNNGAKYANGEWLVFIDDDCVPDKNLLNEYSKAIKTNPGALAFEGAILPDNEILLKKDMAECPVNTKGGFFWSANICVNAKLFKQIGGFDESYLIAAQEDQQLKIDIEKTTNQKIGFLKNCIVIHPVRFTSIKKQIKKIGIASKNFCMYAAKNRETLGYKSIAQFFFSQVLFHVKALMHFIRLNKFKSTIVSFIYLFYGVPLNAFNFYSTKKHLKKLNA